MPPLISQRSRIEINMVPHADCPYFRLLTLIYNSEEAVRKLASLLPEAFALSRKAMNHLSAD